MDEDATITARARRCVRLFEQCPEPIFEDWAEEQLSRFKIWTANLGVFARGHASIDYRLGALGCHSPESYRLILQLLDAIGANLEFIHRQSIRREPVQRLARYLDAETPGSPASSPASSNDDSISLSDDSLGEACSEVENAIRRLNILSASIRRAGARHREVKALNFKGSNRLERRQTKQFTAVTAARIDYMFPRAQASIRNRVVESITLRRNLFEYLKRHQRKLAGGPLGKTDEDEDEEENGMASDNESIEESSPEELDSDADESDGRATVLSGTSATNLQFESGSVQAPSHASTMSIRDGILSIPPPPKAFEGDFFECEYCHVLCDAEEAGGKQWTHHVMNDLAPYICLDPACTTPRVRYRSFKQWVFHMNEHISLEWICYSDNHPEHTFSDVEKYKNHIKKDHDSEIGASQLAALAQAHARPAAPIFKVCPFCDEIPKDLATPDIGEDKLGIYKNLLKHVGKHLQSLALLSLTWLGNRPDLDGDAGENSATDPILPEPIFSELPSSVGISQEMGFDPDWKGIHPYVPDLGDDPAWLLWLSENSGNIHSRETEWLLAEGERVLNLYSKTGPDPMMLEFQLQFRVLTPSQREHHVLIPADEFPAQDTTSKPDITLPKRTDSDDGANENVRVRLMETSERVVSIVESLTVKTDNLASETQQPLREAHGIGYGGEENNRAQESPQLVRRFSDEPLHGSVAYEETSDRFVIDKINYHDTVESINLSMIYNPALELSNQLSKDIEKFLKTAPPKFTIAILPLGNNIPESVVESLETIEKMGEHVSKSAGLLKDLRKSFRNFGRHRKVLMGLGEIVPGGDRFLGIMCGCLKLILRVLSIHKKLADPTLRMLCEIGHAISIDAYIPVTMKWSESVHKAFSRLWVSIFSGLQCILEYYSKNTILRFAKVFASPANMDKMLGEKTSMIIDCKVGLERELQLAVSESTQQASVRFSHNVQELSDVLPSLQPHNKQQIRVDLVPHQETQAANERALIWAALQKMIADSLVVADSYKSADPSYHKQTTVRNDEFIASKFPLSSFKYLDAGDARLTSKALSCLSYQTEFDLPRRDIRTNRKFASGFLQDDRDRSAYVLDSRQLFHWLHPDTSSILVINAGLASTQRRSLGGFICADICHSLRKMKVEKPIILNFFCGEHRDSSEDPDANPAGIINSMLSQLLQQYDRFDPALLRRFTFLDNEDVTQLCAKLSQLIRSLPPPLVVFCVIDRLFLYDDERRGADAAELLRRLVKLSKPRQGRGDHCRFKVLLTGSGRWIAKAVTEGLARDCVLTIPDRVPSSPVTWLCQSRKAFGDFGTA